MNHLFRHPARVWTFSPQSSFIDAAATQLCGNGKSSQLEHTGSITSATHPLLHLSHTRKEKSRERAEVEGGGSCRSWLLALECLPHGLPGDAGGEVSSMAPCLLCDLWPAGSHRRLCTAVRASTFHECSWCHCVSMYFPIPSSSLDYPFLTFLQTSV